MSGPLLMTFNAGSSSVKIGLFSMDGDRVERIAHALIDFRHRPLTFHLVEGKAVFDVELKADGADHLVDVMTETLKQKDEKIHCFNMNKFYHSIKNNKSIMEYLD